MEVSKVKENLGKEVFYKDLYSKNLSRYTLTAYIFRIDPKNPKKCLKQVELQDVSCPHSVLITSLDNVMLKT